VSAGHGEEPLELLRETAGRSPQAVLFAEEAGNTTAQELVALAETRLDAYRRAGIGPGCRVGAVGWPAASFVADVLAVLALDAVVVPLPRQMSEWERERNEELAAITHLVASLDWALLPGAGSIVAGERLIERQPPGEAPPGGAASAQLTSGTSGRTKVALRPVSALLAEVENYWTALDMSPATVLACPVPLHHAYGFGLILAAPLAGSTTVVTSAERPWMLSHALTEHDVTLVAGCCGCWRRRPPARRPAASATCPRACRWTRGPLNSSGPCSAAGSARCTGRQKPAPSASGRRLPGPMRTPLVSRSAGSGSSCARWSRGRSRRPTTRPGKGQV
jgi:hypothetical protein